MTIRAKGVPPHVVAKLNFPAIPEGWYWKLTKPNWTSDYGYVYLKRRRKFWFAKTMGDGIVSTFWQKNVAAGYEDAAKDALKECEYRASIDRLWEKPGPGDSEEVD